MNAFTPARPAARTHVAVLYGGGYNRQPEFTAKLHRNTVATAKRLSTEFLGI
jgi:hypothetical protein